MDDATRNSALDLVMAIVAVAALVVGLTSMLLGKIMAWWDARSVNHSQAVMSPVSPQTNPDQQTDEPDRRADTALSGDPKLCPALRLDKTKVGLITILVYNEWTVSEIRSLLKGDNTTMSQEIAEVRKNLGLAPPTEYRTPIAGRATVARFYESDPELAYQPPD